MSVFTSLYIGWVTVKADNMFAPWFYKKMGMSRLSREQKIVIALEKELEYFKHLSTHVYPNQPKPYIITTFERILNA